MIQNILEKVRNKVLIVKGTTSDDCNYIEPNNQKDSSFVICKSYPNSITDDYQWKIIHLDDWGMLKESTETYYSKDKEEYNILEQIHKEAQK